MEYVRGRNLEQYAQQRRLRPRQAAALVARLARALAVAHRRGVVHLDLKPGNIMVDEAGQPRIIDFGLAQFRHGWRGDDAAEVSGGTPAFMAPEQARGEQVGPASDIFALGSVLYTLLVGKPPFRGKNVQEVLGQARRGDFDRTALRTAGVPRRLERICLRAMATDPAGRHAQSEDLAADLESYLRRPRLLAYAAVAAGLIVAAVVGWWHWSAKPVPQAQPPRLVVMRGKYANLLPQASPVRAGDTTTLECKLPHGWRAAVFRRDTEGKLHELRDFNLFAGDSLDTLQYEQRRLSGPTGTEFYLVCARRSGPAPSREEVAAHFEPGPAWPLLPLNAIVLLTPDNIDVKTSDQRGGPAVDRTPLTAVQQHLDDMRRQLRGKFDFVAGIAFPVEGPDGPPTIVIQRQQATQELTKLKDPVVRPGDRWQLRCELPSGFRPALFRLDTKGTFSPLTPAAIANDDRGETIAFPARGFDVVQGRSRTELFLVCACSDRTPDAAQVVKRSSQERPWPKLPAGTVVTLQRDEVKVSPAPGRGDPEPDAVRQVRERLDGLRRELRADYRFLAAIAFPVQEPEGPPLVTVLHGKDDPYVLLQHRYGPLNSGDRLQVRCLLPNGVRASAFVIGTDRVPLLLKPSPIDTSPAGDILVAPADGFTPALGGTAGTVLVLICGSRTGAGPTVPEVGKLFEQEPPWPQLASSTLLALYRDRVEIKSLLGGDEREVQQVRTRLEQLQQKLAGRFDFVTGLAVGQEGPKK
jgi:hypothetical protein